MDVLDRPELAAFYLAIAASAARHPGVFPTGLAEAVHAALTLSRALPAPTNPHVLDAADFAGRACPLCCTSYGAPVAASPVTCRLSSPVCTPTVS
ncbi:hypothetical protein [Streptomyces sp. NPDC046870]|uniref:hypothetical protein n=1 Tax=Streptomyces sp. NPDC046870 TaxID=3155135 RepID=UPI0034531876